MLARLAGCRSGRARTVHAVLGSGGSGGLGSPVWAHTRMPSVAAGRSGGFWAQAAQGCRLVHPRPPSWMTPARRSTGGFGRHAEHLPNALDPARGRRGGERAASSTTPRSPARAELTYAQLRDETALVSRGPRGLGVGQGDRVVIYMPMIPERRRDARLRPARRGSTRWSSAGSPRHELAVRMTDALPR